MKTAMVPGSFDPLTAGHVDMIERAAAIFDLVYVTVMVNSEKKTRFTLEQRLEIARVSLAHIKNVKVEASDSLLADYASERGVNVLVKGARNGTDFDYEHTLAQINQTLKDDLDTMIFPSRKGMSYISSTYVRELIKYGRPLYGAVHPEAAKVIADFVK